jgi:TonB family C-terminal domain
MRTPAAFLLAVMLGSAPLRAQTRTQSIYTFPFGSTMVTIEARSDSTVRVQASRGGVVAAPTVPVGELTPLMDTVAKLMFGKVAVEAGRYVDLAEVGDERIRVARRAYADSSGYTVAFHDSQAAGRLFMTTIVHRPDLMLLLGLLRKADSVSRRMSGLEPVPTDRGGGIAGQAASMNRPYFEYQVEEQVRLLPESPMPLYPEALKRANVEGQVLAQFVVDTMGRAELSTLKILMSSRQEFSQALRDALPQMRFSPARNGGRRVPQLVQRPFTFATH